MLIFAIYIIKTEMFCILKPWTWLYSDNSSKKNKKKKTKNHIYIGCKF